jgi:hypothetical protein
MLLEGNYTMLHTNLEYRLEVFYTLSLDVVGNYYCNFLTATWMMSIHVTNYNVMKSHTFLYECQVLNNMSKIMEFIYFFLISAEFPLFLLVSSYRQHFYHVITTSILIQSSWITSHSSINHSILILINIFKSHNIN